MCWKRLRSVVADPGSTTVQLSRSKSGRATLEEVEEEEEVPERRVTRRRRRAATVVESGSDDDTAEDPDYRDVPQDGGDDDVGDLGDPRL